MKLKKFLKEESKENIQKILQKDCSKFLKESNEEFLYRGTDEHVSDIKKIIPRKDRKPRDVSEVVHNFADDLFKQRFKWKVRSEGVFTSGAKEKVNTYGNNVYLFYPIEDYEYIWSPKVFDFYGKIEDIRLEYGFSGDNWEIVLERPDVIRDIKKIILSYKTTNLRQAIKSRNEIAFKCKSYYLVRENLLK